MARAWSRAWSNRGSWVTLKKSKGCVASYNHQMTDPEDSPAVVARDGIHRAGLLAWSLLGMLALVGLLGWLLYLVRDIFPPIALATALIFILNPLVSRMERVGVRRGIGTAGIYLLFIAIVVVLVSLVTPVLGRQLNDLGQRLPEIQADLRGAAESVADRLGVSLEDLGLSSQEGSGIDGAVEETPTFFEKFGARLFAGVGRFASSALHVLLTFVLAPIFALYLLIDLPKIQKSLTRFIPPRYRDEWLMLLRRCGQAVGAFFRGQLVVAVIVGIMSSIALRIVGVPFWLAIGLIAGFFNLIPLIGPFVGGGVAALVAGFTQGLRQAVYAALAMLIVQQIDNHFISPKVMGRAVRLHPVAVMIALLVGGSLAGLWGMLLSVPGLAIARIIGVHYYETRVLGATDLDDEVDIEPLPNDEQGADESVVVESEEEGAV